MTSRSLSPRGGAEPGQQQSAVPLENAYRVTTPAPKVTLTTEHAILRVSNGQQRNTVPVQNETVISSDGCNRVSAFAYSIMTNTSHQLLGLAESGLGDLGRVGFDDAGRTVEVLVALRIRGWRSRRSSLMRTSMADCKYGLAAPRSVHSGRGAFYVQRKHVTVSSFGL